MSEAPKSRRRTFGPVVLLGLVGAGLGAFAGSHGWVGYKVPAGAFVPPGAVKSDSPSTTAFALVALAGWGVVLVTRRVFRRAMTVLAGLASLATALTVIGYDSIEHSAAASISLPSGAVLTEQMRAWPWLVVLGGAASLVAAVLAFLWAPSWPEMGTRYDAPAGAAEAAQEDTTPLEERSNYDLWKSMDSGHDPTDDTSSDPTA